ncbi:MAG TPA: universal stress protein [Thermoplasmata archaeon]|nr:universal stress protein [Thermoplasmata archaeon]
MYHRILIPVTAPGEVEPLIRFGANLLDTDGEIRVLHVIPTSSLPEVTRKWRASVNLVLPAHETGAALDVRVDPEVRVAPDVASELLESAETHGVDAILMTISGDKRSRNPFVGRTASAVLHHAASDALIVNRLALTGERVPRLLLPTFSETAPPKALALAEEIAVRGGGIPIIQLALGSRPSPGEPNPAPQLSPRGLPLETRRSFFSESILGRNRRLPEIILREAARERYGLLIVGEEAGLSMRPLLSRSFVEQLFRTAPCPVLAVRG